MLRCETFVESNILRGIRIITDGRPDIEGCKNGVYRCFLLHNTNFVDLINQSMHKNTIKRPRRALKNPKRNHIRIYYVAKQV